MAARAVLGAGGQGAAAAAPRRNAAPRAAGTAFPPASARRSIPAQALGLK